MGEDGQGELNSDLENSNRDRAYRDGSNGPNHNPDHDRGRRDGMAPGGGGSRLRRLIPAKSLHQSPRSTSHYHCCCRAHCHTRIRLTSSFSFSASLPSCASSAFSSFSLASPRLALRRRTPPLQLAPLRLVLPRLHTLLLIVSYVFGLFLLFCLFAIFASVHRDYMPGKGCTAGIP